MCKNPRMIKFCAYSTTCVMYLEMCLEIFKNIVSVIWIIILSVKGTAQNCVHVLSDLSYEK